MGEDFVYHMEDVLDLYAEPLDPLRPVVCLDERSVQLLSEVRPPAAPEPGRAARHDYEYQRHGTCNLFMMVQPLAGWRQVTVTQTRTKLDFADQLKWLADERYPEASRIRLVLDNLNTHTLASLYKAFQPQEANRLARRFDLHYTPKHGSWLDMAEIEFAILSKQCLAQRIPDIDSLSRRIATWQRARNDAKATISWNFTSADARTKLTRLYP